MSQTHTRSDFPLTGFDYLCHLVFFLASLKTFLWHFGDDINPAYILSPFFLLSLLCIVRVHNYKSPRTRTSAMPVLELMHHGCTSITDWILWGTGTNWTHYTVCPVYRPTRTLGNLCGGGSGVYRFQWLDDCGADIHDFSETHQVRPDKPSTDHETSVSPLSRILQEL